MQIDFFSNQKKAEKMAALTEAFKNRDTQKPSQIADTAQQDRADALARHKQEKAAATMAALAEAFRQRNEQREGK